MRFKAVGNAPIMKQNFFKVTVSNRFQAVIQFLRKELGWKAGEPLVRLSVSYITRTCPDGDTAVDVQFTYINLAFSPAPDDSVANLYRVSIFHFCVGSMFKADLLSVVCYRRPPHCKL